MALAVILGFPALVAAQSCFGPGDQVLSFTHPKDASPYYFVFDPGWGNKTQNGTVITYTKGTSKLVFETGSVAAPQSELLQKSRLIFSKYNNTENCEVKACYEKIVDWTAATVSGLPAFSIEFEDKQQQIPTFGKTAVIYGEEVGGTKKYFAVTVIAKELNYEDEKALFDGYYKTFNLELPIECEEPDPGGDGDQNNGTGDNGDPGQDGDGEDPGDSNGDSGGNDSGGNDSQDGGQSGGTDNDKEPEKPLKIFGFDPIIVAAAVILFLLIIFFVVIVIAVIGVVAYFMFFRKK